MPMAMARVVGAAAACICLAACAQGGADGASTSPSASAPAPSSTHRDPAALQVRQVLAEETGIACVSKPQLSPDPDRSLRVCSTNGHTRFDLGPAAVTGANVRTASAAPDEDNGGYAVLVELDGPGTAAFATLTREAAAAQPPGDEIAVVVDGVVVSRPSVQESITSGELQVSGLPKAQADDLAARLS